MSTASKLWIAGLRTKFSNTFLSPKLAQREVGGIKMGMLPKCTNNVFVRDSLLTKVPKIHVFILKTQDARAVFSNTFLSLKLALKVILKCTNNIFS